MSALLHDELAFVSMLRKTLRHFVRENRGFTPAEATDKLLLVSVVCAMMLTSGVSCVHLSPVNDPFVRMSAKCCVVLPYLI